MEGNLDEYIENEKYNAPFNIKKELWNLSCGIFVGTVGLAIMERGIESIIQHGPDYINTFLGVGLPFFVSLYEYKTSINSFKSINSSFSKLSPKHDK